MDQDNLGGFSTKYLKIQSADGLDDVLLEGFTYTTLNGQVISVPAGAATDGASVPQFLWNILPPVGSYWKAAVLHDYLYRYSTLNRSECDGILREAMYRLGVNHIKADIIYHGVRVGGWHAFAVDRREQHD